MGVPTPITIAYVSVITLPFFYIYKGIARGPAVTGKDDNSAKPLLTTKELAAYLEVPVATVYAWRYRGAGPPGFRVGRYLRFRKSDVQRWIADQLRDPDPSERG